MTTTITDRSIIEQRLRFLQIDEETLADLRQVKDILEPGIDNMLDELYTHLLQERELREIFGSQETVERSRKAQRSHWLDILFSGDLGLKHFEETKKIGRTHERDGVTLGWYLGAYCFMLDHLIDLVMQKHHDDAQHMSKLIQALSKVVFLDIDFVIDSYLEAKDNTIRNVLQNSQKVFGQLQLYDESVISDTKTLASSAGKLASGTAETEREIVSLKEQMDQMASLLNSLEEDNALVPQLKSRLDEMTQQLSRITQATEDACQEAHALKKQTRKLVEEVATSNLKKSASKNTYSLHQNNSGETGIVGRLRSWAGKLM